MSATESLIERPWRCDITGFPVGTDTRMIGAPPCDCQGCRAAAELEALRSRCERMEKALELIASASTVAGMHDQDRAPKLQAIAARALQQGGKAE